MKNNFSKAKPKRKNDEPPLVTDKLGWRYHHLGIPTSLPKSNETYLSEYKMSVSGFDRSPYGIEWMRFEPDSPISELIQKIPHIAFEVENLELALAGKEMLGEITSPSAGVRVAMIMDNGAPIELIEFNKDLIRQSLK